MQSSAASLPEKSSLRKLLNVVYQASLLREEQRSLNIRIIFCPLEALAPKTNALGAKLPRPWFSRVAVPLRFETGRPFTISEVRRIAPACDPTRVFMVVTDRNDPKRSTTKLELWGLVNAGAGWWDMARQETDAGYTAPDVLTIFSNEPGELQVSTHGKTICHLRQGELVRPSGRVLAEGPISDVFSSAGTLVASLAPETLQAPLAQMVCQQYLYRLVRSIEEMRHGGTLLIVPHEQANTTTPLKDILSIKYRLSSHDSLVLLVAATDLHKKERLQWRRQLDQLNAGGESTEVINLNGVYWRQDLDAMLADDIKCIAALSGVDGAVVMTDRLAVLGFGAEILVNTNSLNKVLVAVNTQGTAGKTIDISAFGTRHRSAFRFCSQSEKFVAFIVSQDGGVKAVKRCGSKLVMWLDALSEI